MDHAEPKTETQLEREVACLLSCWDQSAIERIDALFTDCAAAALRLAVARLRIDRELDEIFHAGAHPAGAVKLDRVRQLFAQRRQLTVRRGQIEEMTRSLRRHRDRLTPLRASRI